MITSVVDGSESRRKIESRACRCRPCHTTPGFELSNIDCSQEFIASTTGVFSRHTDLVPQKTIARLATRHVTFELTGATRACVLPLIISFSALSCNWISVSGEANRGEGVPGLYARPQRHAAQHDVQLRPLYQAERRHEVRGLRQQVKRNVIVWRRT